MRLIGRLSFLAVAIHLAAWARAGFAQSVREFHRTLPVTVSDPVTLEVQLSEGELQIAYGRQEQVSIRAIARTAGAKADNEFFATSLSVEQAGNHLRLRDLSGKGRVEGESRIVYRIDVPYWTEVLSVMGDGKQTITGVMGPVIAATRKGDIKVCYVSKGVVAKTGLGNLDLEVIGERVEAKTGNGNISCIRAVQGVSAETEDGDIVLVVVGPSNATVKTGIGRIEVTGAKGSLLGSTVKGDLQVKAMLYDDWRLSSASGNIRVELPPATRFEVDATTNFGEVLIDRDDIEKPSTKVRYFQQKVNGGGKRIEVRTDSGKIVIR
ncbi:MAG TPA: DUF4097 family beta strand repeat-containing protein [Blastocatellia bacterium]|nr:DUF4097 family beta strand repeat-containing protein [Blastocatellia bacterium]